MSPITGPHDTERTLAKPVEVVTKAIREAGTKWCIDANNDFGRPIFTDNAVPKHVLAVAAIDALKSHGWLTEGYFTAAKAERDGK